MSNLKNMNILVTGVAGDIGLGVGRILKAWLQSNSLYGIDIHHDHPASHIFDSVTIAPRADSTDYILWLLNYIKQYKIELLIPTSEAEIKVINNNRLLFENVTKVLISNDLVINVGLDKFECMSFLASKNIAVPLNGKLQTTLPEQFPVIVKPNSGQGSKSVSIISSKEELTQIRLNDAVWQELLLPDDEEYTCAVFSTPLCEVRTLILRRKLSGGLTVSGEVVSNEKIEQYIIEIAKALSLHGVMNIQLRLTARGPLLFEINPRLSSTLVFRDKLGFCDLKWWIYAEIQKNIPEYVPPQSGTTFYRGAQEYIIPKKY